MFKSTTRDRPPRLGTLLDGEDLRFHVTPVNTVVINVPEIRIDGEVREVEEIEEIEGEEETPEGLAEFFNLAEEDEENAGYNLPNCISYKSPIYLRTKKGIFDTPTSSLLLQLKAEYHEGRVTEEEYINYLLTVTGEREVIGVDKEQEKRFSYSLLSAMCDYNTELERILEYVESPDKESLFANVINRGTCLLTIADVLNRKGEICLQTFDGYTSIKISRGKQEVKYDLVSQMLEMNGCHTNVEIEIFGEDLDTKIFRSKYDGEFRLRAFPDGGELTIKNYKGESRVIVAQQLFC